MISALLDNYIYQHQADGFALKEIIWKRVLDVNDRSLRSIVTGLGPRANGLTQESGFDITPASEIMAILCLSTDLEDMRRRIDNILLGYRFDGTPFQVKDLGVTGAILTLMIDAIKPNLVQTLEGTPAFVHGGPFANIAHGCNTVLATKLALGAADYAITEAGFGADLGGEKFLDIKCRAANLKPSAVVVVGTVRALKMHGGLKKDELGNEDLVALEKGIPNLLRHVSNIKNVYKLPCVVAINRFPTDTDNEIEFIIKKCKELGVNTVLSTVWADGGKGGEEMAKEVVRLCNEEDNSGFSYSYELDCKIEDKIEAIVKKVYGGDGVDFTPNAQKQLQALYKNGFDKLPVCVAKTQYSFSDDATKLGAPENFRVTVKNVKVSAGAGFIVVLTGEIMTMPGLPKVPSAEKIDVSEDGKIVGLF
jgi:formate--tetrahydrofolate ligase